MDVVVGRIGRAHGIHGEVRVELRTDSAPHRFAPGAVLRPDSGEPPRLTVRAARPHDDRLLVRFEEVGDRTVAESLRGTVLYADADAAERPGGDDEYYDWQLTGLRAVRTAGDPDDPDATNATVGEVVDVLHLPGQEVLVIRLADGQEALVPFVSELVPSVDLDAGTVEVADQPGLLDPEERI